MVYVFVRNRSFKPYKSPVTGEVITTPAQDRAHQKKHEVVNVREFGSDGGQKYFDRKKKERDLAFKSRAAKKDRLQDVINSYNKEQDK